MVSDLGKPKRGKQSNTANSTFSENKKVFLKSLIPLQEKMKTKIVLMIALLQGDYLHWRQMHQP